MYKLFWLCGLLVVTGCGAGISHDSFCENDPDHEICVTDPDNDNQVPPPVDGNENGNGNDNEPPPVDDHPPAFDELVLVVNTVRVEDGEDSPEFHPGQVLVIHAPDFDCSSTCTIRWLDGSGREIGSDEVLHWTVPNRTGRYEIICVVTDGRGRRAEIHIFIIVVLPAPPPPPPPPPPPVNPPPVVSIVANGESGPITLPYVGVVGLGWTSSNATSCEASGAWSGPRPVIGSENSVTLRSGTHIFAITCTGSGGSATDSVVVNVNPQEPPPPTNWTAEIVSPISGATFYVDDNVQFVGRVTGLANDDIAWILWDFPDTDDQEGDDPSLLSTDHTFVGHSDGPQEVEFEVTDRWGRMVRDTILITVLRR